MGRTVGRMRGQLKAGIAGGGIGAIAGDVNGAAGEVTGVRIGELNGKINSMVNAAELQKQIDDINEKIVELFSTSNAMSDELAREIATRTRGVNDLIAALSEETANRISDDKSIYLKIEGEVRKLEKAIWDLDVALTAAIDKKQDALAFNVSDIPITAVTLTSVKDGDRTYVIPKSGKTVDWTDVADKPEFKEISVSASYYDLVDAPELQNISFNEEIPSEATPTKLRTLKDGDDYYVADASTREVRDAGLTEFVFRDEAEVTYSQAVDNDISLIIPPDIAQGFISLLTIADMEANRTISVAAGDPETPFGIRIVSGGSVMPGTAYVTSVGGKKIIFCRCDGIDIEILIIEEL